MTPFEFRCELRRFVASWTYDKIQDSSAVAVYDEAYHLVKNAGVEADSPCYRIAEAAVKAAASDRLGDVEAKRVLVGRLRRAVRGEHACSEPTPKVVVGTTEVTKHKDVVWTLSELTCSNCGWDL